MSVPLLPGEQPRALCTYVSPSVNNSRDIYAIHLPNRNSSIGMSYMFNFGPGGDKKSSH